MIGNVSAAAAGRFTIGDFSVNRLGFGAMRITGEGVWGEPRDRSAALETLRSLRDFGVNFVDTADSYGPFVSENLIREVLYPYDGILIATKGGFLRTGPGAWTIDGKPEYLRQCVLMSLRRLGLERIELWQLHRIDASYPRAEQFGVIRDMQKEGLIGHVGLSEVSVDDIREAQQYFEVATVQNMYNLVDRRSEDVLDFCEAEGIGFIPWFPLAAGDLATGDSKFAQIAKRMEITPSQLALAWILKRSRVMLPIPGTSNPAHLRENVAAANVDLTDEDYDAIERESRNA
jgi:pyridoxine 4-dehydrogenase